MKIYKEFGRNPHVDWTTLLVVSIVITVGLAFMSLTLYNAVVGGGITDKAEHTSATFTKLNEKVIEKAIVRFEERENLSAQAKAGYSKTTDPSL